MFTQTEETTIFQPAADPALAELWVSVYAGHGAGSSDHASRCARADSAVALFRKASGMAEPDGGNATHMKNYDKLDLWTAVILSGFAAFWIGVGIAHLMTLHGVRQAAMVQDGGGRVEINGARHFAYGNEWHEHRP